MPDPRRGMRGMGMSSRYTYLEAECTVCGGSIISMGRDASARASIATFKREHAEKHTRERKNRELRLPLTASSPSVEEAPSPRPTQDQGSAFAIHYRPEFGKPTACGRGFLAHAVTDWNRVDCEVCLSLAEATA